MNRATKYDKNTQPLFVVQCREYKLSWPESAALYKRAQAIADAEGSECVSPIHLERALPDILKQREVKS